MGFDLSKLVTAEQKQKEAEQQAREQRIAELKKLLTDSDYKFNIDYDEQNTAEWTQLKADRQDWRLEIRTLESLIAR